MWMDTRLNLTKKQITEKVKEAQALAKKAVEYDKSSFIDAAAYFYQQAARLLFEAASVEKSTHAQMWLKKANEYKSRAEYISVPLSHKQLKRPEMIMLAQCRFLFHHALDADEKGDYESAIKLYEEAVNASKDSITKVQQPALRDKLDHIMRQALQRSLILKSNRKTDAHVGKVPTHTQGQNADMDVNSISLKLSGKSALTVEEKGVLLKTSKINKVEYVPFMSVDLGERFELQTKFVDKDGLLPLSPKQRGAFYKWMRPGELYSDPKVISGKVVDCFSIKQTIISDCSFVASLSVAAQYERQFSRRLITSIIFPRNKNKEPMFNPSGKYMVRLHLNGVKRKVIIDDLLPVDRDKELLSSFSTRKGELWISLLEKAYMKVMGGYDFPGSNSNIDLHALTGWIPERVSLSSNPKDESFDADQTFRMIHARNRKGDLLMTVATPEMTDHDAERAGLVSLHAYAVLDVKEIEGKRLIQLKNPWSHVRWKGNYSERDTTHWTKVLCQKLDYDPTNAAYFDNGVFWIDYKSLLHFFDVLYINWNPNMFAFTYCLHESWSAGVGPAKDCYTVSENPQYRLKVDSTNSREAVWILLSRHITDIEDFKYNKEYITVLVYDNRGKKVYYPYDPAPIVDGVRINSPHYLAKVNLENAKGKDLTLVISQYEKTTTIYYTLRVYSTCPFTLSKILDIYRFTKKILNGEWKGLNAGGCRNHSTYDYNPEYVLSMSSSGSICVDLRAPAQFRIGFDIYPKEDRSNEAGAPPWRPVSSGPYRLGFVILEVDNLPEGDYYIVPSTFKPREEARFFLTVKSTCPIDLQQSPTNHLLRDQSTT